MGSNKKPSEKMPHALLRGARRFPLEPSTGPAGTWPGWLSHREYDVLDMHIRMGVENIYFFIKTEGLPRHQRNAGGCEKLFTDLVNIGLLKGEKTQFKATEIGHLLYKLTDAYLLQQQQDEDD